MPSGKDAKSQHPAFFDSALVLLCRLILWQMNDIENPVFVEVHSHKTNHKKRPAKPVYCCSELATKKGAGALGPPHSLAMRVIPPGGNKPQSNSTAEGAVRHQLNNAAKLWH